MLEHLRITKTTQGVGPDSMSSALSKHDAVAMTDAFTSPVNTSLCLSSIPHSCITSLLFPSHYLAVLRLSLIVFALP